MASRQLIDTIDGELGWREPELALAKVQLQRSLDEELHFRFSYRCFVSMTYAHYEAFVKRVIAQSLQDIFNSGHPWSKCNIHIRENLFAGKLRDLVTSISNSELARRSSLAACFIDSANAPSLDLILDIGNMNVSNFIWSIKCIGLEERTFWSFKPDIAQLTSLRHSCAHGDILTFDQTQTRRTIADEMFKLQARIILAMHTLSVEIIDHFENVNFLEKTN